MGKEKKPSFADKLKAGITKAGDEATKIAKKGMEVAKDSAEVVAEKSRSALNEAYDSKRPTALKNLQRLRKAHPECSPQEIIALLEDDLKKAEVKSGSDSDAFTSALTLFVFTTLEIYGSKVADKHKRQLLVDSVVVVDSEVARLVAQLGGAAVQLFAGSAGAVGKAVSAISKAGDKLSKFKPLMTLAGIKNPGKKSATWIVTTSTLNVLGPVPKAWPKESAAKGK